MMMTTRSNELMGSVVLDGHVLNHIGDVFTPISGSFQELVDFLLPNQRDRILIIEEKVGQKVALHFVGFVFQTVDFDAQVDDGPLLVQRHESVRQESTAAVYFLGKEKHGGRNRFQPIGDDPERDIVNTVEDVVELGGQGLNIFGIEGCDESR